jgi:riboflavin kinase/FMN adenylyltransferase
MRVHFGLPAPRLGPAALAIGSFDGVHLGHRAVLDCLLRSAREEGLAPALITFDPHPRCVLDPASCPPMITTLEERLELMGRLGVQDLIVLEFNRALAALTAAQFIDRMLAAVDVRCLVVGYDFALGRGREGDVEWLAQHGSRAGFRVEVVPPFRLDGQEVHSSEVRRLLTLGDVEAANRLLGREFGMTGLVLPGDRVGREIGWPTVNLSVAAGKLVPARGIYAGWAGPPSQPLPAGRGEEVNDRPSTASSLEGERMAAISIGYRPTFTSVDLRVEAYLLDFSGDLYQRRLALRFVARLHDELKFPDVGELAHQIARDVEATRRLLGGRP